LKKLLFIKLFVIVLNVKITVVKPTENFRGMSYSEWVTVWCNWLLSEDPDTYDGGDMLFLRGNVNLKPVGDLEGGPRHLAQKGMYDRTGRSGERIFEGTSIMIPVIVSMLSISDVYEGTKMRTPQQLWYYTNIDIERGAGLWATIMKKEEKRTYRIVENIKDYKVVTPLFKLIVPDTSKLMNKMDIPIMPGLYDTVAAGFFILIRSLPPSTYRINFGGQGIGEYHTNSLYDIVVQGRRRISLKDDSNRIVTFKQSWI
jgi:hypothetical protein